MQYRHLKTLHNLKKHGTLGKNNQGLNMNIYTFENTSGSLDNMNKWSNYFKSIISIGLIYDLFS